MNGKEKWKQTIKWTCKIVWFCACANAYCCHMIYHHVPDFDLFIFCCCCCCEISIDDGNTFQCWFLCALHKRIWMKRKWISHNWCAQTINTMISDVILHLRLNVHSNWRKKERKKHRQWGGQIEIDRRRERKKFH